MNRALAKDWALISVALPPLACYGNPAIALCVGALLTSLRDRPPLSNGIRYGKWMLQAAIVLLGLRFAIDDVIRVSGASIHLVIGYVLLVLAAGLAGGALLGVDRVSRTHVAGGTAIATLAPILRARPEQLAVALAIHDTSSIVATAARYGDEALEVATVVKLGRTLWLIPLAVAASLAVAQSRAQVGVPGCRAAQCGHIRLHVVRWNLVRRNRAFTRRRCPP